MSSFVGRQRKAAAVAELLLRPDVRLVTLTGPGGIGKTRLAQDVAASLVKNFADGVVWVPLAPITEATFVVSAIAQARGIRESGEQALVDAVKAALRDANLLLEK